MKKLYLLNCDDKYIKKCKEKLNDFDIEVLNYDDISKSYENVKLKDDYVRLKYIYENPGLLIDGNFEVVANIDMLLKNKCFLGFETENTVSTRIVFSSESKNKYFKEILESIEEAEYDNITDTISDVVNRDLKSTYNSLVKINDEFYIYPYDYFYPLDYEKHGKNLSENTKLIIYKDEALSFKRKLDLKIFLNHGAAAFRYYMSLKETLRNKFGAKKYSIMRKHGKDLDKKALKKSLEKTLEVLDTYKGKNVDYIIFHNPRWMGVSSATKELFENLAPLEELPDMSFVNKLAQKIIEVSPKQIIFSAFADGWSDLAIEIKKRKNDIKLKSFWHGSHSQVIEDINWRTNVDVITLHKAGFIDVMGTCKESLLEFYKSQGYKSAFIKNTVRLEADTLKEIESVKEDKAKNDDDGFRVGMYAAGLGWRKNMFSQLAAASLNKNVVIDSVPLSFESEVFTSKFGDKIEGVNKGVKRNELLKRLARNDINLYVTFSECAPMLPIESMEVGTLCLSGNNHHYFKGSKLRGYLVVDREDDVIAIYEKMKYALENKEEILKLYKEWKQNYDLESKKSVQEFLDV